MHGRWLLVVFGGRDSFLRYKGLSVERLRGSRQVAVCCNGRAVGVCAIASRLERAMEVAMKRSASIRKSFGFGKLRKREEHSNTVHPADVDVVLQTAAAPTITTTNGTPTTITTATATTNNNNNCQLQANQQPAQPPPPPSEPLAYRGQFLWQFPPTPPPPCLYNNNQDGLVQSLPTERPGFVRGFRKNLGGRWRRLVKRKPEAEVYSIPAELKPQLKQIYVY